ncbi:transposable element Tc1 transposase [Trichonephila clavipes]|nr:transposable element Tc1 transposase [Trichonephila clavipes]
MIQVLCQYACSYTPRWRYNQEKGAMQASANSKIHKRDDYPPIKGRLWSAKHASDSFNDTSRRRSSNCLTNNFQTNLKSKRPFRALPLTPEHRQLRLLWCQARSMWNVTDWQNIVFSEESRFVLGTHDNCVRVWRRPGAIFHQDNARPHTARVAQDFIRHFQTLPWPGRSPDLSPVEHVWDQLKRQMPSCHSVHDLELAVQDLCAHLPQDNRRCLINSMRDRVAACIAAGGGPTRY